MHRNLFTILFVMTCSTSFLHGQFDTLKTIFEFNSPASYPWGIAWDGTNLWISDNASGKIYKSGTNGYTLDSIEINNAKIAGITFIDDTLWGVNCCVVGETITIYQGDTATWPVFSIYKIKKLEEFPLVANDAIKETAYIQLFPTPANDFIMLEKNDLMQLNSALLLDVNGRIIEALPVDDMNKNHVINISHLTKGVYFIRFGFQNGQITRKIIKL
jgi:hypothetical protein